jgi:hypothetical protein
MDLEKGKNNQIEEEQQTIECLSYTSIVCICIISYPIIIGDLYFGFSNDSCLHEELLSNFNLKTYLIVSGIGGLISLLINMISIFVSYMLFSIKMLLIVNRFITPNDSMPEVCMGINKIIQHIFGLFSIIWTFLGSILFWNNIYPNDKCNEQLTSYVFISLLIKIISYSISIIC